MNQILLFLLLSFTNSVATRKIVADKTASTVTYAAQHPLHKWEGVSHSVNSAIIYNDETRSLQSVAVSINVASFDSRNSNRDSHAMEVLEGLKYPNVTFASSDIKPSENGALTAIGNLTFHGITKPMTLQAMRKDAGGKMTITGEFKISLTEFKIERPSLMGLKTDDEMTMKFAVVFPM